MNQDPLLTRYRSWLAASGYSPQTTKRYSEVIAKFLTWLLKDKGIQRIQDVTREILADHQNLVWCQMRVRDGAPISLSMKCSQIVSIKNFFRFLIKKGEILYNPASGLEIPKQRRDILRSSLNEREILKVLRIGKAKTPVEIRDRAMLELYYSTGMRNTELRELSVEDVDLKTLEVRVLKGKGYFGHRERVIPMGREAAGWVEEYLKTARPLLKGKVSTTTLFITRRGKKLTIDLPNRIFKRHARMAGIKQPVKTHMIRHSFATHLLRHGCDIRHVQAMLGHESLDSTKIYTKVEISDLKKIHRRTHPRERR